MPPGGLRQGAAASAHILERESACLAGNAGRDRRHCYGATGVKETHSTVGTIGIAGTDFVGTAKTLRTAADINGKYSALAAGMAVADVDRPPVRPIGRNG